MKIKVLITAGGTTEAIDEVRGISNFATGRLGRAVALAFLGAGHQVSYLAGRGAARPSARPGLTLVDIGDTASLMTAMEQLVPTVDVVVHSMAVSDYRPLYMTDLAELPADWLHFSPPPAGKISSRPDHQVIVLEKTPKVLSYIKTWNPRLTLFAFKLLVDVTEAELVAAAQASLQHNRADFVLANDLRQIDQQGHHAILVSHQQQLHLHTKAEIAQAIVDQAERAGRESMAPVEAAGSNG